MIIKSLMKDVNVPSAGAAGSNSAPTRQAAYVVNNQSYVGDSGWVKIPQLTLTITTQLNDVLYLSGSVMFQHGSTNTPFLAYEVDAGVSIPRTLIGVASGGGPPPPRSTCIEVMNWISGLAAGDHTIDFYGYENNPGTVVTVLGGFSIQGVTVRQFVTVTLYRP